MITIIERKNRISVGDEEKQQRRNKVKDLEECQKVVGKRRNDKKKEGETTRRKRNDKK